MPKSSEHQILQIIKYTPPIVITMASIIITLLIYSDYSRTLKTEKQQIQETFTKEQKKLMKQYVEIAIGYTNREYKKTSSSLKTKLQHQVSNAKTIMQSIYEKNKDTKSKEEITRLIKDALREIRFNKGRGYFFIHQMDGVNILHPILPKREGTNIGTKKDRNGVQRFKVVHDIIRDKSAGFATFHFYYPHDKEKQKRKIVYVENFEPFDWMIGTGEYLEDFENQVKTNVLNHLHNTQLTNNGYYIVLDYKGTLLSHPKKNYQGQNIQKAEHLKKFIPVFNQIKKIIQKDEGYFTNQASINPSSLKESTKTYFAKTFPKWQWVLISGFYHDDLDKFVKENEQYLEDKYTSYLNTIIYSSFFITILLLFVSIYVAKILEDKFLKYKNKLENEITENIKQKNMLKKAQKVAKIGDWELDLKTMKAHWSEQILEIFGLEKDFDKAGPKFLKTIMHKDDWKCFKKSFDDVLKYKKEHKCIYRIYRPDKSMRWIDCRGHLNEKSNTISGIIQDITENKNLEIEKLHREELLYQQSKMAAMGEMIGNIAHQWRQPLSSISTAATGIKLQKELEVLTNEQFEVAMDTINQKAQYLSHTIDDFREFYKSTKKENTFLVSSMIDKTINLLNAQFVSKDIQVIQEIEEFELFTLENELIQVIINVLNNSRDALVQKEKQKRLIFIKTFNKEEAYYICIWDNAGGIKKEILNRVFEPYFTTKHQAQGTGIGLYMSEEIMSKHLNGAINARNKQFFYEDEEYLGAEFNIILYKNNSK